MLLWDTAYSNKDFIILLVFAILIICCEIMNEKVKNGKIEELIYFGGRLSYIVFLNHYIVAECFTNYGILKAYDWKVTSIIYLIVVLTYSLLQYYGFRKVKNIIMKVSSKIRTHKV